MSEEKEKFLSRWSRLKQEAKEEAAQQPASQPSADSKAPPPDLPPIDKLTLESDYRGFFHPKVDESLRRAALKKLFSDPHFNVMDGLDVYIEDYSQPNLLPAALLAQLRQAQKILDWAKEAREDKREPTAAPPDRAPQLDAQQSGSIPAAGATSPSEDASPARQNTGSGLRGGEQA